MSSAALSALRSSLDRLMPSRGATSARLLPLGIPALDAVLPQGGLVQGTVTELQVRGASGAATSFALCACRAAQAQFEQAQLGHVRFGRSDSEPSSTIASPWCAFIDSTSSLFAPGVARLGVDLKHLLVVRPELDAVSRVAVRIAEARIASVLVIDLGGAVPKPSVDELTWQRTVRRLALALESTATIVLLLTSSEQFRSLPLPTYLRLEFTRTSKESFEVRVGKERTGRISAPRSVAWSALEAPPPSPEPPGAPWAESRRVS